MNEAQWERWATVWMVTEQVRSEVKYGNRFDPVLLNWLD